MNTIITRKYRLLRAVLASSCLMVPGLGFAANFVINAPGTAAQASVSNGDTFTITANGDITTAVAPGITITHSDVIVNMLTTALSKDAIIIGGGLDDGIEIQGGGTNATINIETNRNIDSANNGISIAAASANINNSGTISGANTHGISVLAGGKDAIINNLIAASIIESSSTDAIDVVEEGVTITNAGTIRTTGGGVADNAIQIIKNFEIVTNNPGATIDGPTGNAIQIGNAGGVDITGTINNSGTIQTTTGQAINISNNLIGNINNTASGIIQTTGGAATGEAIFLQKNVTAINNSGKIIATNIAEAIRANAFVAADINNNSGGEITSATGSTILLTTGLGGSISNTLGTMKSTTGKVIEFAPGNLNGSILNLGGTIETGNNNAIFMNTMIMDGTFNNTGTIKNTSAGSATVIAQGASVIKTDFLNSGTIINSNVGAGTGLNLTATTVNGKFTNSSAGNIEAAGTALLLNNAIFDSNFDNSGTIKSNTVASTFSATNTTFKGNLTNPGSITNSFGGAGGKAVEMVGSTINGNMTNSGTSIIAGDANAILWNNTNILGNFTNSGLIQNDSAGNATIEATGNTKFTGGFFNTGTIENLDPVPKTAIDFSGANVEIKLNQNGGTITGDVLLSGKGGAIFDMTGGTIDGDVTATNNAANTLNLSGGTITEDLQLGTAGDTLNLSGTTVTGNIIGGAGNDTVNITGGSFAILAGAGVGNTLNINGSFTTPGTIDSFQTINANAGTFTVTQAITQVDTDLLIAPGATVISSGAGKMIDGNGTLSINGSLGILSGSSVDMGATTNNDYLGIEANGLLTTTAYTQNAAAELEVEILTSFMGPYIDVGAGVATLNAGSVLKAQVGGEFIPDGSVFTVIDAGAGSNYNIGTLVFVQPPSATVSFVPSAPGNDLLLTSVTTPFSTVIPRSDITNGVASALDTIASTAGAGTSTALTDLLGQLQTLSTAQQVEDALRSLVPSFNNSIAANSNFAVRRAFDDIGTRFEDLLGMNALLEGEDKYHDDENEDDDDDYYNPRYRYRDYNQGTQGTSYGDGDGNVLMRHTYGTWIKPYATFIDQRKLDTVEGYRGDSVGFSMGADWRILDWATIGSAVSMAKTDVSQRGLYENKQKVDSYQLSFYGHFDPIGPIYVNSMIGLARHRYNLHRTISVGNLTRQVESGFHGLHYAAKFDVGYAWFNGKYYLSPVASMRFGRLDLDNYSEKGGGGLDLIVRTESMDEIVGSLGFKMASKNEYLEATYIPELAVYLNYDFQADRQETLNNFIAGGPSFLSYGIEPEQLSYVISPSFRMHTHRNMMFKISYEFEAKKQYIAHTAYFKWYYKWA